MSTCKVPETFSVILKYKLKAYNKSVFKNLRYIYNVKFSCDISSKPFKILIKP